MVHEAEAARLNVIIPVYNQSFALAQTLYGFTRQTKPYNKCRIIVVDDGSDEPVDAIVEAYSNELNINCIRLPRSGRAAARNAGIQAADADTVVFCDADRIPQPGFISAHARAQQQIGGSVTVGHVREMYVSNPEANRSLILKRYENDRMLRTPQYCNLVYGLFGPDGNTNSPIAWVATLSGNLSVPLSWLRDAGGFDDLFKEWGFEHMELGYRLMRMFGNFHYEAQAVNVHIAHPRAGRSYVSLLTSSHALFAAKYPGDVAVSRYLDFMLGRISLRKYESIAGGTRVDGESRPGHTHDGYVKITNGL
ncbi:glycosyltransferase family 2 protein [Paenibacillus tarimensis]|uniref:glycosyltransferase family 2 protein n=1 Tax=Paenibacillus tarimensis TaxID=416012 RepID=UPI001F230F86|nr:glycosyltransferase family A protein [Paenibacillus tarimensis]MCF2945614.1 glycosyltransferase family 2 protein [Paenibacillus tarimensis]